MEVGIVNYVCVLAPIYRGLDIFIRKLTVNSFKGNGLNFQFLPVDHKIRLSDMTLSDILP